MDDEDITCHCLFAAVRDHHSADLPCGSCVPDRRLLSAQDGRYAVIHPGMRQTITGIKIGEEKGEAALRQEKEQRNAYG